MPPKSARKRQQELILVKAREAKIRRESGDGTYTTTEIELQTECGGTDDEPEGVSWDPTFGLAQA